MVRRRDEPTVSRRVLVLCPWVLEKIFFGAPGKVPLLVFVFLTLQQSACVEDEHCEEELGVTWQAS